RSSRPPSHVGPASASRTTSPAPSPPGPYYPTTTQLSAPSHNVVWAFVADTFLYVSTDRGDAWAQRALPAVEGGGPLEVSFVDANQGWLSVPVIPETQCNAAGIAIWHTSDGARTRERLTPTGLRDPADRGPGVRVQVWRWGCNVDIRCGRAEPCCFCRLHHRLALVAGRRTRSIGRDDGWRQELARLCVGLLAGGSHRTRGRVRRRDGGLCDRARR